MRMLQLRLNLLQNLRINSFLLPLNLHQILPSFFLPILFFLPNKFLLLLLGTTIGHRLILHQIISVEDDDLSITIYFISYLFFFDIVHVRLIIRIFIQIIYLRGCMQRGCFYFKFQYFIIFCQISRSRILMLNKLKNTVSNIMDADKMMEAERKKVDVSVLTGEEIKIYKKILEKFKENVQALDEIGQANKEDLMLWIKNRAKQAAQNPQAPPDPNKDEQDTKFTFAEDMKQIKQTLNDLQTQIKQILAFQQQIINKVNHINDTSHPHPTAPTTQNMKNTQQLLAKYEQQIAALKKSEDNNKEILNTLGQQSQLYMKEMRELQEKGQKLEKELNQKNVLINNLKEEKNVLLEMRNSTTAGQLPEVEALKYKLTQFQKRLNLERSKVEAKQKQIQSLKKKMEEQHQSLEKIADELKQKELKSKKIIDKYERSKTQIRKFREQKTQFIKQLNMEVAKMSEELAQEKKKNQHLTQQTLKLKEEIENLKSEVSKNQNRKIELESSQAELVEVRSQLHGKNMFAEQQALQIKKLKQLNDQLQNKRKQLLQALQKPINHQIRTLQKILKALDKLYKDYITTVFQDGNIVGFEAKITYIISNIQEIKEDLLL